MKKQLIVDAIAPGPALIKYLASCSAPVRSRSLRLLEGWLLNQSDISDDDMKKFWKGLFYCLWHSDKAPAQSHLINRTSSLVLNLDLSLALKYFSFFLITLKREWVGIDRLRLDKFYLLVRKFVHAVFDLCKKHSWNVELLNKVVAIFINSAFLAEDKLLGNGVCYHIASVWLDELNGCNVHVTDDVVGLLFKPLFEVMKKSEDRVMVVKVKSCVFDELLKIGGSLLEKKRKGVEENESYAVVALGLIAMKMGFSGKFFEIGSSLDCLQGNRKTVFKLHEEFLKLEKRYRTSGVDIVLPEVSVDEEEIPELVPIVNGVTKEDDASECHIDESFRRCKKAKMMQDGSNENGKKKKNKKENGVALDGEEEMSKEGKNKCDRSENASHGENIEKTVAENGISVDSDSLSESVISNLRMEFEKVAAEISPGNEADKPNTTIKKKRKRGKSVKSIESCIADAHNAGDSVVSAGKSEEKSAKKVRFAMKNNLVWKPHSPMPPQSLRLPPSSTPRGSALKKGVPPGPIREMPLAKKKRKLKKKGKKMNTISPAMKRLKKTKAPSP
ncbi:unnamed protein product [Cuscuta campestris]|uniref:Uncharacterized protein n=1 Tax=Cuscuta campestris TaxID=132261 RepID=A0A484NIE8_9ASTE|nr:unnamed protein product [Cuscuta campestris]